MKHHTESTLQALYKALTESRDLIECTIRIGDEKPLRPDEITIRIMQGDETIIDSRYAHYEVSLPIDVLISAPSVPNRFVNTDINAITNTIRQLSKNRSTYPKFCYRVDEEAESAVAVSEESEHRLLELTLSFTVTYRRLIKPVGVI